MADSVNSISLSVVDAVAPEIAPKLIAIADACDKATSSVGTLKGQLAALKGSGLNSLSSMLTKLESGTLKAATAQTTLTTQLRATTNALYQESTALGGTVAALGASGAAAKSAAAATKEKAASDIAGTAATKGLVSGNIAGAATLGILEGRTLSMNRAATNFLTKILGLGPALQSAFVVIGAVALLAVLGQMAMALTKVIKSALNAGTEIAKAFDSAISSIRRTTDALALTDDKLEATINRLQHKPTTNGMVMAIDEALVRADKLDEMLDTISEKLDGALKKESIGFFSGLITGQGNTSAVTDSVTKTWDAVTKAEKDSQAQLDTIKDASYKNDADRAKAIAAMEKVTNAEKMSALQGVLGVYQQQYNAVKAINDQNDSVRVGAKSQGQIAGIAGNLAAPDLSADLTILGSSAHLAQAAINELKGTMRDAADNKKLDGLHDELSAESAAAKQAAKEWKTLEAAFVSWETASEKAGHKPTAQQSLGELQTLGKNINPLNQDKLDAKEQPYQSKIAGDDEWIKDQSDKLKNQIAEIGLYNNALKEQAEINTITQAAQKRGITLSADEIAGYKKQIATIVESKDSQKELETIYQDVNGAQEKLTAGTEALTTLWERGQITGEQHNQGITEMIKQYNEATSAVAKLHREMSEQQRDASNKLGTQSQIAVKTELQGVDTQLRKPGVDSQHPFGYSESEIARVNAALAPLIAAQQRKNAVDQAANKLINQQEDLTDQLTIKREALAKALAADAISQGAYSAAMVKLWIEQNDQQLKSGKGGNPFKGALADYAKQFNGVAAGIKESFSSVFKTLGDGFADSIGRALTGTKNLGQALKQVARSAIGELISSLIKLGLQYVTNLAMGTSAGTAATAVGVAQATALGTC